MTSSVLPPKLPKCHFKKYSQKRIQNSHQACSAVSQKGVPSPLKAAPLEAAKKDIQINKSSFTKEHRKE